jgi:hypothetical protein
MRPRPNTEKKQDGKIATASFTMERELLDAIKETSREQDLSMSQLVRKILRLHLSAKSARMNELKEQNECAV